MIWQPGVTIEDLKKDAVTKALAYFRGNKTKTAGSLGISIRTLDNYLERYNGTDIGNGNATAEGTLLQSGEKVSEEQSVSVSKRKEVQKVSPGQVASRNS